MNSLLGSLPGWFKAKVRFQIDGEEWISDGKVAVRWPADPSLREVPDPAKSMGWFDVPRKEAARATADNGLSVLGSQGYAPHFIDLAEFCHPLLKWHAPDSHLDGAVGYVDGKPVAIVVPIRDYDEQGPYKGAPCPECDGSGLGDDECKKCDGSGETECDHCGHESDCETCDGEGWNKCAACNGTGIWTPKEAT